MTIYNDAISEYVTDLFAEEDDALRRIRTQIKERGLPAINIQPEEGRFLQVLVRARGTMKALEIGTLGGYSGTWIARGLAPGGRLITVEVNPEHAAVAREHFRLSGVEEQVEIVVGDAHERIRLLAAEGPFDFVFIDAEKSGYLDYFDWALENTANGGVIVAHNAFQHGDIVLEDTDDENTKAMRAFNQRVASEPRVIGTIYPGGDGMVLAVKVR